MGRGPYSHPTTPVLGQFVCIDVSRPSQQLFSHVETEQTLPEFNQYYRELMCQTQGHSTVTLVGVESRTSRFGTDALPLRHHAP